MEAHAEGLEERRQHAEDLARLARVWPRMASEKKRVRDHSHAYGSLEGTPEGNL